jgi:hypothetical protein
MYSFTVKASDYDGNWSSDKKFNVNVTSLTDLFAALKVDDCYIREGQSSCPMYYSWQVFNPKPNGNYGVKYMYSYSNDFLSKGESGVDQQFSNATYGEHSFYVVDGTTAISSKITASARCERGTKWNPSRGPGFVVLPTEDTCIVDPNYVPTDIIYLFDNYDLDGSNEFYNLLVSSKLDLFVKRNGKDLALEVDKVDKKLSLTKEKIPYNGKATIEWKSSASSCLCKYTDSTKSDLVDCVGDLKTGPNDSYVTPSLKRDTTYNISCKNGAGNEVSKSVKILVDKIDANYIER